MNPNFPDAAYDMVRAAGGDEREALATLTRSGDLGLVDGLLGRFNIFEAIGMVGQEIRHSTFLAFLIAPRESHGLGDAFLRGILRLAYPETAFPASAAGTNDLNDTVVFREWQNIDILVLNATHRMAVVIENKVYAGEQPGQLDRYYAVIRRRYPDYQVRGIFLTLDARPPARAEDAARYASLGYQALLPLLGECAATATPDVRATITHYVQMLRRNLVGDAELEEMCLEVYRHHRRAIDAIIRYLPNRQARVREVLEILVQRTEGLVMDSVFKDQYMSFCPASWDGLIQRIAAERWTPTGRNLTFWFGVQPDTINITLQIRGGPLAERKRLFDIAVAHGPLFNPDKATVQDQYTVIYRRVILDVGRFEAVPWEMLKEEIAEWWDIFCANDLQQIDAIYCAELRADKDQDSIKGDHGL